MQIADSPLYRQDKKKGYKKHINTLNCDVNM